MYAIGSEIAIQKYQPASQVATRHTLSSDGAIYVIYRMVLVGIDPGSFRLGGHYITDGRRISIHKDLVLRAILVAILRNFDFVCCIG